MPRPPWIVGLVLALLWTGAACAQSPARSGSNPPLFDCSAGPDKVALPLHMVTYVAQQAHYCAWNLDKLTFETAGQPIYSTQRIDNYIIYQDVSGIDRLTHCGEICHAPFAVVADARNPVDGGQLIATGIYRIAGMARFAVNSGAVIEIAVVELVPPAKK